MSTSKKLFRPLLVMGTRPEVIKLAPVAAECARRSDVVQPVLCFTGQHREMLEQAASYFDLVPDINLNLMTPGQSPAQFAARCLEQLDRTLESLAPDCVVAQGDTTTVLAAALAAFYRRLPLVHVEAGLRTGDLQAPWPEEFHRRLATLATTLHCAPTETARQRLLDEGVPPHLVHVTGNTVIDALLWTAERERQSDAMWSAKHAYLQNRKLVLITGHRRESFGQGLENICQAVAELAADFPEVAFVYPVHLNPQVQRTVRAALSTQPNVYLSEPAPYPEFVWLMTRCHLLLTDSGGIQEEAPSLKKPVVVTRNITERQEAVDAGAALLVGDDVESIVIAVGRLLTDPQGYQNMQIDHSPYGDGRAAKRIVELMLRQFTSAAAPVKSMDIGHQGIATI